MATNYSNPATAAGRALRELMLAREIQRRTQVLDGIELDERMRQRQIEDLDCQRRERLDAQAEEDRQRRIQSEDATRDLAALGLMQPGDQMDPALNARLSQRGIRVGNQGPATQGAHLGVDDQGIDRYDVTPGAVVFAGTPAQRDAAAREAARVAERDADRRREELRDADDNGRRHLDSELQRQEREAQRTSNERVARINASGRAKTDADTPTHDAAAVTLDALDELSARINDMEGLAARGAGSWRKAAAIANYDDDLAEYEAVLNGAIPSIARKMGHTGVLTQPDVDSVRGMFPKPGDSKTLRDRKMARIRKIMNMPPGGNSGNGRSGGKYAVTVE